MSRYKKYHHLVNFWIVGLAIIVFFGCSSERDRKFDTRVSLSDSKWHFNGEIINPDSPAEGLLMNVRMVNSVFEDRGTELQKYNPDFDPAVNTDAFIEAIPEYVSNGVNAFTISLQGGLPGYEGAVNTAFNSDGSLRPEYMQRVEKVIKACDINHAAVILTMFYQRQHSHQLALNGKEAIFKALEKVVNWISEKEFTNVMLEISNEYRHGGYSNWPDGEWLRSEAGQVELMDRAKEIHPELLVSTSGMGNALYHEDLANTADFLLIHFNNTSLEDYGEKINALKKYDKPIVSNEDDKVKIEGATALALAVQNGSGWGYMNARVNQDMPFEFSGAADDTTVYHMFRRVTTPGFQIDPESLKQTSIVITSPNDGDIFQWGETVRIELSHLYPNRSVGNTIELLANGKPVAKVGRNLEVNWQAEEQGVVVFEAVVKDDSGAELYRSPKMDIIVQPKK